jgi:hypothetical protein
MILPTKHIRTRHSLIALGSLALAELPRPSTVSELRDRLSRVEALRSYDRFLLTLDFLYMIGAIEYANGRLARTSE